ncbi:MAG: PPC domain-containing protein [Lentisphaeraceae bacterium]|nr:PPC domain-containing protein [Lentisphaeraceae bacterium]
MKSLIISFCIFLSSFSLYGQDGHIVDLLLPQVYQAGTSVKVYLEGANLDDAQQVVFYDKGFKAGNFKVIEPLKTFGDASYKTRRNKPGQNLEMTIQVHPKVKPGEYFFRLRTRDELSPMLSFWVTKFPIVEEKHADKDKRNDSPEYAQEVSLNSTIIGYLNEVAHQDYDWYKVKLKKGQKLSVQALAMRLGTLHYGGMNDTALEVYNEQNEIVAANSDNSLTHQDPFVTFKAKEAGFYYIRMMQQMDYETSLRHYALHIGDFSRPSVTYPLGGETGKTTEFTIYDDAVGSFKQKISLKNNPGLFEDSFQKINESTTPSPNRLHIVNFPNVMERSGKKAETNPQTITKALPVAINGRIESEGEVDCYKFKAIKGQKYRVRVFAKSLGSELDSKIWIKSLKNGKLTKILDADDSDWPDHDLYGHDYRWQLPLRLDSVALFEPSETGEYIIGVEDTRREFSEKHIYRIEFEPHVESAFVSMKAYYPSTLCRDRIVLFPGKSMMRPFNIRKGFGSTYKGKLQIVADNLPKGVSIECEPFTTSDSLIPVMFHASKSAQVLGTVLDLRVEPVNKQDRANFKGGYLLVNPATDRRGGTAMYFYKTRKMALAVCEKPSFNITMKQPKTSLAQNGELILDVYVKRENGYKGAVYCAVEWMPKGMNVQPPLIIPEGKNHGTYKIAALKDAKAGIYPISITGREEKGGNYRHGTGFRYIYSKNVKIEISEPFVNVDFARANIERGKKGSLVATINHVKTLPGSSKMKLVNLPYGVTQLKPYPSIDAQSAKVEFKVEVSKDCLINQYKDISCEVLIMNNGQLISQKTGSGVLRVDPERKQ